MNTRMFPTFSKTMAALAAVVITLCSIYASIAQGGDSGTINIIKPWARPTLGNVMVSATYLSIVNKGKAGDKLIAAKSDVAGRIEIHETVTVDDVARMQPVAGGVTIPAEGAAKFVPMGKHIMMMGLKKKLVDGDTFPMTLVFENQGEVKIEVKVLRPSGKGSHSGSDKGSHDGSSKGSHCCCDKKASGDSSSKKSCQCACKKKGSHDGSEKASGDAKP